MTRELTTEFNGETYVNTAALLLVCIEVVNSEITPKDAKAKAHAVIKNILALAKKNGRESAEKIICRGVIDDFTVQEAFDICDELTIHELTQALKDAGFPVEELDFKKGMFK